MEGYLELRHDKWLKSNKKYYFILTQTRIIYFDSQEDSVANSSSPEGFFSLRDVVSVELSQKHKQSIQINTTTETLVLKAKEDSVLWRWMGTIKENAAKVKVKDSETKSTKSPSSRSRRKGSLQSGGRRKLHISKSFSAADQDVNRALRKIKKEAVEGRKPFGALRPGAREARSEEDLLGGKEDLLGGKEDFLGGNNNLEVAEERRKRQSGNSVISRESLGSITRGLSLPPGERVKRKSGNSINSRESSEGGSPSNLGTRSPRIPITSALAKSMVINNECHMRDSLDFEVSEDFDNAKAETSAELSENVKPVGEETRDNAIFGNSDSKTETLEFEYPAYQVLERFNDNNGNHNQESTKIGTKDDGELGIRPRRRNSLQPILKGLSWLTIRRTKKKDKDHPHETVSGEQSFENMEQSDEKAVNLQENGVDKDETVAQFQDNYVDQDKPGMQIQKNGIDKDETAVQIQENGIDKSFEPETPKDDVKLETGSLIKKWIVNSQLSNTEKQSQLNVVESKFKHHRGSIEISKEKDSEDELQLPRSGSISRARTSSMSSNKRTRTFSETSAKSDDITDGGGIAENVKSKVNKWKQKSIRKKSEKSQKSSSKFSISGPMPVAHPKDENEEERQRILAEIDAQCAVEFTSKDIEDILNFPLTNKSKNGANQSDDKPPEVPTKPIKFQIRQLELLQGGSINPRQDVDQLELMLRLESLKVVANLDAAIQENGKEENIYDTPRPLNLISTHYISRISMQSDSDASMPETDINTFRPRIPSINSRGSRGSGGSAESTVVLRHQL